MEDSYIEIGYYYDAIVGDRASASTKVKKLIKEYAPKAKALLEVACGTGSMLAAFEKSYTVSGLDFSETMLGGAREKLPDVPLYLGDMRDFSTGHTYDVITCMFDSINHATKKSDWKKTFRSIRKHLEPGGLFIFDVNTLYKLENLSQSPPIVHEFEGHTYILAVEKCNKNRFNWHSRIFAPVTEEYYSCIDETVAEAAYTETEIKEMLKGSFKVKKVIDFDGGAKNQKSNRICFICEAC